LARADGGTEIFIQEYQVQGAHLISKDAIEEAVYPYLGPGRTKEDVEKARLALEKVYHDLGYQTVAVSVPAQSAAGGVIVITVAETPVGRLRVAGARYFSPHQIKAMAPSLAPGKVPNFNEVPRDLVALNQNPDRRVTPVLRSGEIPGTVDIDLNVQDTLPLHGSLELNNRYSPNTTDLRVNGSVTDNNIGQIGDTAGFSFQLAPERLADAQVFSGYYLAPLPNNSDFSLMAQATRQDSNVSTLGGVAVTGKGDIAGLRAILKLPGAANFYESLSGGVDYKHFDQTLEVAGNNLVAPITYYPFSLAYSATLANAQHLTEFNADITWHLRGLGSSPAAFNNRRYEADGGFIYVRGDLAHTLTLHSGWQLYGKMQLQVSSEALLDSEQFTGGGLGTVRGYLESEVVGDDALVGSAELRTPALPFFKTAKPSEWRIYLFSDNGRFWIQNPLPEQESRFSLNSVGAGSRIRFNQNFNGSIDAGIPLVSQLYSKAFDPLVTFRLWADF